MELAVLSDIFPSGETELAILPLEKKMSLICGSFRHEVAHSQIDLMLFFPLWKK
jgi:hypothetical protein